jgi:hypothetical protein
MASSVGILAFGSLISDPGAEIEAALIGKQPNVRTPFSVEFARSSRRRGGAPTLVPVLQGGSPVAGQILLVNLCEQDAMDRLWRREINQVGRGDRYVHHTNPGPNTLIIDRYENLGGVSIVLAARFSATIDPLTPEHLAEFAIISAKLERTGRDGISYLIDAKRNGVATPLSPAYEAEILRRIGTANLCDALRKIRAQ